MKRMSRVICTMALLLMSLSAALSANAANLKARSATLDPATGYPTWYQDNNNLALTDCLDQSGFCLPLGTTQPLPAARANISAANFPVESFYFLAEVADASSPGGTISGVLYVAALEAGFAANVVDGGQAVFTRIRIRADVTLPGTYVVTHPYGTDTFEVTTPGVRAINFSEDIPGLVANQFDAPLTSRVGPFLTKADGTFVTDTATGNRYLANPNVPVAVTGGPNGNVLTITAPNGDNLTVNTFMLQGKVIGMDVTPTTNNLGAATIGGVPGAPQTVTVTNTTGAAITFPADLNAAGVKGGADAADFIVGPPTQPAPQLTSCINTAVAAGAACGFDITFTPVTKAVAARTATIKLEPTVVAPAVAPPPVTLNLTGTAQVLLTTVAGANGTIEPATGPVNAGTPVIFTVTPSSKKFKVKEVADGGALLGTPVVGTPPFSINTGAANHTVTATFMPSGDLDGNGTLDVADAMKALKIVAGLQTPAVDDNAAADVAPLVANVPAPDGQVGIGDVLVMLRKVIGLDNW